MSVFLYQHKVNKLTLKKSAWVTVTKVEEKWLQAGLTISKSCNAIRKMLKLFNTWLKLKKNQYRKKSPTQKKSELLFVEKSRKLFDVAQLNLMQNLDENKKLFLAGQKSDKRYGFIDANVSNKQIDETTMEVDVDDLNQPSASGSNSCLDHSALSRNQSTSGTETATSSSQRSENISEYQVSPKKQNVPPKIDVMNAELASALDRANISNGDATYVLSAAYKSVGINIETLNLSCSTIRRARIKYRQSITEHLKNEFKIEDRYIVHWDGKILTDIVDPKSVDRIAILLSSMKVKQLLGVPKIFNGSAENHSVAILDTLIKWNVTPYIKAMCFDTTAVNTGSTRKRPEIAINAWRCELLGNWGTTVCRDLLGIKKQPCKQHHCQMMKARLHQHQLKCRASKLNSNSTPDKKSKSTMKRSSPMSSAGKLEPTFKPGSRSTQTKVGRNSSQDKRMHKTGKNKHRKESNRSDKDIVSLHSLQALIVQKHTDILSRRTSYSGQLNSQIQELLHISIPHANETVEQNRLDIVKHFVNKMADLLVYINDEDYDDKVKYEIEQCLNVLKMADPHLEQHVNDSLRNSLLTCINTFNEKWSRSRREKRSSEDNTKTFVPNDEVGCTNKLLENDITDWVESNLHIATEYDEVTNILISRIKSIIKTGVKTKHDLKADIMNVLEELSHHWHSPKNKTKYRNKLATILTDMLFDKLEKYNLLDKYNSNSNHELKSKVTFEVQDPKLSEKIEDDVINQITDILFGNIEVVLHENSHDVVEAIRLILEATGEYSSSEALSLAKTIVGNVRYEYCFNEDVNTNTAVHKRSSSFIILTSEHELSGNSGPQFHSTPADKEKTRRENWSSVKFGTPTQGSYNEADDENVIEFVTEYIEKNFEIDDDIVEDVLKVMLKQEIYKLSPSDKERLYKKKTHEKFKTKKFKLELEIVKKICRWLRRMPSYYSLLQPGSETTEFVHGLARNLTEIEVERSNYPNRMNYDSWLHTEIAAYLLQKVDEMSDEDRHKLGESVGQLILQIKSLRTDDNENDQLTKIINEHMKKFDHLLEEDCVKKILWHRRLAEALLNMLRENSDASLTELKQRLTSIPIPRDESVIQFKIEIKYDIVIQDWLDTFSLLPSKNNEDQITRKNMVKELSQKIMEFDRRRSHDGRDDQADGNLDNYISDWISNFNLDPTVSVDIPMKISLLRDALESVRTQIQPHSPNDRMQGSIDRSRRKSKTQDLRPLALGQQMVEAIEDWCNNLPIKENDQHATKAKKELVATKIFQVVGSLSDDPDIAHDYKRFREMLANEIDVQLQNLSNYAAVEANKNSIKVDLLDKIMEIKKKILDVTAGDDYVEVLEKSIDLSTNHLRRSKKNAPEYELFKKRMVMLWLLQTYDYAVDFHSLKYKKILTEEIRFLTEECKKRNIFPADNEEVLHDITHLFFKANSPEECAIIDEVENVKLRCEIELWAKELPLKEADSFEKLLERDQVLTILTKMLFDIEKSGDDNLNMKMKMQIMKWTAKLPLLPAEKNNLSEYADLLLCILKSSANSRKCQRQAKPHSSFGLQETLNNLKSSDKLNGIKGSLSVAKKKQKEASPVAGPSKPGSCGQPCTASKANNAVLITTAINNWCHQLPLKFSDPNEQRAEQIIKLHISQRLLQLVSELHYRPNTLSNEDLYEHYLNNEIDHILTQLIKDRIYWEDPQERNIRKYQIINALKEIRYLVKEEKDREGYKEKLKHTISSFHESMAPYTAVSLSTSAQNAILHDFMQYKNHTDFESQELYKSKIQDALINELDDREDRVDPLLATNKLIYELSKVKSPKQSQREMTQSDTKRRLSQPTPLDFHRPPANTSWHSLPYPLPQMSLPRFLPQNNPHLHPDVSYREPVSQNLPPHPAPSSISTPSPRITPPQLVQEGSARFSNSRNIEPEMPHQFPTPPSISSHTPRITPPVLVQEGSARFSNPRSIEQEIPQQFPLNQSQASQYWSPMAAAPEVRPYPLPPPPPLNFSESNTNQSQRPPRFGQQRNIQPELVMTEPSFNEPGNDEQVQRERFARPDTRTTARVPSSTRSSAECPEERRRNRQRDERWQHEYCETCKRDRDCEFYMPRPYPMPRDYMYD